MPHTHKHQVPSPHSTVAGQPQLCAMQIEIGEFRFAKYMDGVLRIEHNGYGVVADEKKYALLMKHDFNKVGIKTKPSEVKKQEEQCTGYGLPKRNGD